MAGLSKSEKARLSKRLAISERFYSEAEKVCPQRKAYNTIVNSLSEKFKEAIDNKDVKMIFDLEEIAQEHDAIFHSVDKSKSQKIYSTLLEMKNHFFEFSENPEKIKSRFGIEIENLKMSGEQIVDGTFVTAANSVCGFINSFKSPRCVPSENTFYSIRSKAIREVQSVHQRHIDQAIGFETKDRGLSR